MDAQDNLSAVATGSAEGGFIVDLHDGLRHMMHISHAGDAEAAENEARDAFGERDDEEGHDAGGGLAGRQGDIDKLHEMLASLTARVEDLEKHREGVKAAKDKERGEEAEKLRQEADDHKAENERLLAEAAEERERNKPDAHGRRPGEDGPQTAATMKASEPEQEVTIDSFEPAFSKAEQNAHDAATPGVENEENPVASAKNATYAVPDKDRQESGRGASSATFDHERYEELVTKPDLSEEERAELDDLRSRKAWQE